ncbi:FAD-linked oxidase C-terminal domain-containing protein [Paludisphaera sp.]|uniref:FAD-binding oxidoreductase n=1 Tax=Paludisphaera sp. TaxID=2017432 RepID=UPI00301B825E
MATTSTTAAPSLVDDLTALLGAEGVLHRHDELVVYECDGYVIEKNVPDVVVFPTSTEEVVGVVKLCNRHDVPFVPRGAGTSLAGGTLPVGGGVMISLTRMKRIVEVNARDRYAIVEAGVVNVWLTRALAGTGVHFAPDPSSQTACTIGGNVATNAGGPHTLKYGVTINHVRGVELVTPEGEVVQIGGVVADQPGLDLTGLLVGSEGTFGIVTKVTVGLSRDPEAGRTLLAVFPTVEDSVEAVSGIVAAGIVPAALEMIDNIMIRAVEAAYNLGFPLDSGAVLIIEVDGVEAAMDREAEAIAEIVAAHRGAIDKAIAWRTREVPEYKAIWKARKMAFGAIGRVTPTFCTQDGVVPRTALPHILRFMEGVSERCGVRIANVFHAGDGNLHPIIMFDEQDPGQVKRALQASHEILDECIRLGGSVTGEHGIGVEKIGMMPKLFSPDDLAAMTAVHDALNPDGRCSPHKKIPVGGHCIERTSPGRRAPA